MVQRDSRKGSSRMGFVHWHIISRCISNGACSSLWQLSSIKFWKKQSCSLAAFICDFFAKGPRALCGLSENEAYPGVWSVLLQDFCADSDP